MNLYDKLYSIGFSIAGFQFLGLGISAIDKPTSFINKLAYFIISINFVTSISSSLLSFCMYEFINSLKNENNIYIISGILNYRFYLTLPHLLLLGNTALFIIPINILIYNILSLEYAYSFNIF